MAAEELAENREALLPVYEKATSILMYRDPTFPKDSDRLPDGLIVRRSNTGHTFLKHVHTVTGKQANQEVFHNKFQLAGDFPSAEEVDTV